MTHMGLTQDTYMTHTGLRHESCNITPMTRLKVYLRYKTEILVRGVVSNAGSPLVQIKLEIVS